MKRKHKPGTFNTRVDRCGVSRKRRYRTRGAAEQALSSTRAQASEDPRRHEQRTYRCPLCDGWHLTSQQAA